MTIFEIYKTGLNMLKNKTEVIILIQEIFNINRTQISLNPDLNINKNKKNIFFEYLKRIKNGEPIQYILKQTDFFGIKLKVGPGVFIPRPETELLVEYICKNFNKNFSGNIIDLCSGSGAIAICLKNYFKKSNIWAIEKSPEAFEYLIKNTKLNNTKINYILGDIFTEFSKFKDETFDIIISNPPYVKTQDIINLEKNISFEPHIALDGGTDGLDFYKNIIKFWGSKLKKNAIIIFELGINQHKQVQKIIQDNNFINIKIIKDFSNIERIIMANKRHGIAKIYSKG